MATVRMRCPECGEEWNTKADKTREEWGVVTYYADDLCPECEAEGEVIDDQIDRDCWADIQYDSMIEEQWSNPERTSLR